MNNSLKEVTWCSWAQQRKKKDMMIIVGEKIVAIERKWAKNIQTTEKTKNKSAIKDIEGETSDTLL